jgi:class 3 adenylate cyclase
MPLPLVGPATDPPRHDGHGGPLAVERSFAFVDVCGFTAYCDRHGEQAAIEVLTAFRAATRDVVGRRGVRVAKWLGDGVMLVGTAPSPVVAVVVELVGRARAIGLDTHAGVAAGPVLMFEGDDYVGRTVNLAARLCDAAAPGEVLGAVDDDDRPDWVHSTGPVRLSVPGMGRVGGIHRLAAAPEVEHALRTGVPAA